MNKKEFTTTKKQGIYYLININRKIKKSKSWQGVEKKIIYVNYEVEEILKNIKANEYPQQKI